MSRLDVNIIISNPHVQPSDAMQLFGRPGDIQPEPTQEFPVGSTLADLMVHYGIFPSKGQARKAGFGGEIPGGFSDVTVGKLRHRFWIWNPTE